MTLAIHKLSTRCQLPKGNEAAARLLDDIAHLALPQELSEQIGPSLDRLPAVVRIRSLRVKLKISGRHVSARKIATGWARALTLALHRTLAYPDADGATGIVRYFSRAAYQAAMLQHLLGGGSRTSWRFPEVAAWKDASLAQACLELLRQTPSLLGETLAELAARNWLDPLLMLWDEATIERIMRAIAVDASPCDALSLPQLIEIAETLAAAGGLQPRWAFHGRRQAIRLWMRLAQRLPIRQVWHALRLLRRLLETPLPFDGSISEWLADPIPFPAWCAAVMECAVLHRADQPAILLAPIGNVSDLETALAVLRPSLPTAVSSNQRSEWISTDCAGILLLTASLRRFNFWKLSLEPEFKTPDALSFLLAGLGMSLLGPWQPGEPVNPAVAILSGCDRNLDRSAVRTFFASAHVYAAQPFAHAHTWEQWFLTAGDMVIADFARRIRGFRHMSRAAAVKQFLRVAGRVFLEDRRILVELAPTPWAVALHISGADDRVENVEWLAGKTVEFILEGL